MECYDIINMNIIKTCKAVEAASHAIGSVRLSEQFSKLLVVEIWTFEQREASIHGKLYSVLQGSGTIAGIRTRSSA